MERHARGLMLDALLKAREAALAPNLTPEQRERALRLFMDGIVSLDRIERSAPLKGLDG